MVLLLLASIIVIVHSDDSPPPTMVNITTTGHPVRAHEMIGEDEAATIIITPEPTPPPSVVVTGEDKPRPSSPPKVQPKPTTTTTSEPSTPQPTIQGGEEAVHVVAAPVFSPRDVNHIVSVTIRMDCPTEVSNQPGHHIIMHTIYLYHVWARLVIEGY